MVATPPRSDIDSTNLGRPLRRLLKTNGKAEAPNQLNTDLLQPVIGIDQGGFAIHEVKYLDQSAQPETFGNVSSFAFPLIGRETSGYKIDNLEKETRILSLYWNVVYALDPPVSDIGFYLQYRDPVLNTVIQMNSMKYPIGIGAGVTQRTYEFSIYMPSYDSRKVTSSDQRQSPGNESWKGFIPESLALDIVMIQRDGNFPAGMLMNARCAVIQVPKGCRLPL